MPRPPPSFVDESRRGPLGAPLLPVGHPCSMAFCVSSDAFRWAQRERPQGAGSFFSHRNPWQLTPDEYRLAIKQVATHTGLDPSSYSSHSLRIAGDSTLAAAGKADWFIKTMGRWKSLAFLPASSSRSPACGRPSRKSFHPPASPSPTLLPPTWGSTPLGVANGRRTCRAGLAPE